MGIVGLWNVSFGLDSPIQDQPKNLKLLMPAADVVNLRELSTIEGLQRNPRGNHTLHIGVDT
jgi:hypothetical protein